MIKDTPFIRDAIVNISKNIDEALDYNGRDARKFNFRTPRIPVFI